MPQARQRDALGVLTKPRLLKIADALGLGLPGRTRSRSQGRLMRRPFGRSARRNWYARRQFMPT